eukprot:gene4824-3464_t
MKCVPQTTGKNLQKTSNNRQTASSEGKNERKEKKKTLFQGNHPVKAEKLHHILFSALLAVVSQTDYVAASYSGSEARAIKGYRNGNEREHTVRDHHQDEKQTSTYHKSKETTKKNIKERESAKLFQPVLGRT